MTEHGDKPDDDDKNASDQQGGAGEPLVPAAGLKGGVKLPEAQISQDDRSQYAKEITKSVKRFVNWAFVISAVVTVATVAQALTSYYQLGEIRRQNQVMVEQNKVARRQLAQMELDQRPWLGITPPILEGFSLEEINQGRPTIARFMVTNSGKTPAIIVEGGVGLLLRPSSANTDDLMAEADAQQQPRGRQIVVAPHSTIPFRIELEELHHRIDPEMFDAPVPRPPDSPTPQDHGALWLVARLHYLDASGQRYGPTECCYRYDIQAKGFVSEGQHNRIK